jgi:microcystin-dependent protein
MQLVLPYDIINNTPADAVPVEANYNVIAEFTNSQVINRDGSVSMDAPLLLKGDPTETGHAANKGYVDGLLPVGIIMPFGGVAAPAGDWLLCDGASKSTSTYKTLFDVLGYRYGGSGGNFLLPKLNGRVPVGVDATKTEYNTVGKSGGSLALGLKAHTHAINHDHAVFNTSSVGGSHSHSIDHNHAAFPSVAAGAHDHDISWVQDLPHPGGDGARMVGYVGSGLHAPVSTEAAHTHSIDVPAFAGLSGPGDLPTHLHTANVPSYAGTSGSGGTDTEQIPPFVIVTYIIRAA